VAHGAQRWLGLRRSPASVHGGFVAALFDQFMGVAQAIGGQPGMTGTLSTRYHRRTPLNTELCLRGWVEKIEGRKTFVRAEIRADDVLTASCDGVFVQPRAAWKGCIASTRNRCLVEIGRKCPDKSGPTGTQASAPRSARPARARFST